MAQSARLIRDLARELEGREPGPVLAAIGRYYLVGTVPGEHSTVAETSPGQDPRERARKPDGATAATVALEKAPAPAPDASLIYHVVEKSGRNGEVPVLVGRYDLNDIIIDHPSVSRTHAGLYLKDGALAVIDYWSKEGSWVDGEAVPNQSQRPLPIRAGQVLAFGDVELTLVDVPGLLRLIRFAGR